MDTEEIISIVEAFTDEDMWIANRFSSLPRLTQMSVMSDEGDLKQIKFSLKMQAASYCGPGSYGLGETSGGLTAAQRVMRKIKLIHIYEDEFEADCVY